MALHKTLIDGDIHIIYAYTYSDATARNSATGFLSTDIGKVSRQTDNNSFWILTDVTPIWSEITGVVSTPIFGNVTVGKSGLVDFNTIKDGVAQAIANGASSSNPYTVSVYPGTYIETNPITIPAGVIVTTISGERQVSSIVKPSNPLDDLFIINNGTLMGVSLSGVTDPLKALIRTSAPGKTANIHAVSVSNCSNGVIIENGSIGVLTTFVALVAAPASAITTAVSVDGYGSTLIMSTSLFNVPAAILPFYAINPITTCVNAKNGALAEILNSTFQVTAKNSAQTSILIDDPNTIVRVLGTNFDNGYTAIKISSSGTNATASINSCTIFNHTINFSIQSSSGLVFEDVATDSIKRDIVTGGKIAGIVSTVDDRSVNLTGNVDYFWNGTLLDRQTRLSNFIFDRTSSGLSSGGAVTFAGGLDVNVAEGTGWVRRQEEVDSINVSWNANIFTLIPNSTNYVFFNGSSLALDTSTSGVSSSDVLLGQVFTDGYVRFIHNTSNVVSDSDAALHQYLLLTRKFTLDFGLAVSQGSIVTKINIDIGSYYVSLTLISFIGAMDATFSYFYDDATVEIPSQTDVDITNFDNLGTLTTMTDGYYRADIVYLTSDGRISLIYGTDEFPTATQAEQSSIPSAPVFIEPTGVTLAKLIILKNFGINNIVDLRPLGTASGQSQSQTGITDHGLLSGLLDDDHPQYLLVSGFRPMAGDLDMGTNNVVDVGLVDGVDVSNHGSRHNPGQIDALTTAIPVAILVGTAAFEGSATSFARSDHQHGIASAIPVTISTANSSGTASTVSRSDHVHSHGSLPGGNLHNLVIADPGGTAGFISSTDKQKLDGIASGATNSPLSDVVPSNINKSASSAGVATEASRRDHKHNIDTAVAGTINIGDTAAEGSATTLSRSDHTHALIAPAAPANVTKAVASAGAASTVARSDHKHDISTATVGTINVGDAAAEGTATSLARSDHVHALTAPAAPANVDATAASTGAAATVARSDHKHNVNTGTPVAIGITNSAGTATTLSLSDHVHRGTTIQNVFDEITTDTTTGSTTFVDLLSQVITTTGGNILIYFTASASNSNANTNVTFRITVDTVSKKGTQLRVLSSNVAASASIITKVTGLSAAAHTVAIQWKTSSNTARIAPATAAIDIEHASLIITEVTV